jgi:hypothetical protein
MTTTKYTIAYVGARRGDGTLRALTDWHGAEIGVCRLTSSWRVDSYIGTRMHQITAWIKGVRYTGRGFGEGMSVRLRPTARQA